MKKNRNLGLHNLRTDHSGTNNLLEEYPEVAAELEITYKKWAEKVGVETWDELILARKF